MVHIEQINKKGTHTDANDKLSEEMNRQYQLDDYEDVYKDLFDLVPCFITVQNSGYELLRYNREFYETFDPKPGDRCYKAYKGRTEKCVICPVEMTFEDGKPHWSEESGPNKDGDILHWVVRTSPIKNSKGEIVAVMEMCLDITHKKKLEGELEVSEKKYRAIFNNIPNPLFVLDTGTLEILDCNGRVQTVYGYSNKELINRSFLMFFKSEEREDYSSMLKSSFFISQVKHLTKNGREIFVNVQISPSKHLDQDSFIVTTSNITQHVEMEQQLIQTSKMATLGEMATGVAHELNQPLSVIKTASDFFIRKVNKNEEIEDDTLVTLSKKIGNNVDRATKIINHLREFGRKSDRILEKVQVNDVLRKAHGIMGQQLKLRGIVFGWDLQADLPLIMADSVRLEQVIINLLMNARDAIEEKKGKISGDKLSEDEITLKTISEDDLVKIEIRDTGPGIPKNIKDKIFEPFFTTKQIGKGTGLGLSISYGIIKDFEGRIGVVSNKDQGACFVITFPILDED